ncbi:glycerol-3-phosphate acyltransferase [Salinicola endophyticus]|uniref:Glycerol-3-phosphate acyltransferase n=1 Tax=Salinicola endophyticus TaxID=1949083 RepID=A0ABY8FG69_9GAMM|nr:glycerol-3-phosphate acyltransferase [Salinicola endophyticus]WFF41807.1 glycerol-3-phosphate acyltransferase [Salinicola endophyticus]
MPSSTLITIALASAGYLSGSLLGAIWVCRLWGLGDPRRAGSGNPGFSNVLRAFGWRPALATLVIDAGKGMPVLWLAGSASLSVWAQGLVGLGVLLGHSCPVWHRGHGGKAVASAFGVLLMLATPVALICAGCWFLLAWRVRTAAVASLATALIAPLLSYWLVPPMSGVICVFSTLVLIRHAFNIRTWRERRRETVAPALADPLDEEDALEDRRDARPGRRRAGGD